MRARKSCDLLRSDSSQPNITTPKVPRGRARLSGRKKQYAVVLFKDSVAVVQRHHVTKCDTEEWDKMSKITCELPEEDEPASGLVLAVAFTRTDATGILDTYNPDHPETFNDPAVCFRPKTPKAGKKRASKKTETAPSCSTPGPTPTSASKALVKTAKKSVNRARSTLARKKKTAAPVNPVPNVTLHASQFNPQPVSGPPAMPPGGRGRGRGRGRPATVPDQRPGGSNAPPQPAGNPENPANPPPEPKPPKEYLCGAGGGSERFYRGDPDKLLTPDISMANFPHRLVHFKDSTTKSGKTALELLEDHQPPKPPQMSPEELQMRRKHHENMYEKLREDRLAIFIQRKLMRAYYIAKGKHNKKIKQAALDPEAAQTADTAEAMSRKLLILAASKSVKLKFDTSLNCKTRFELMNSEKHRILDFNQGDFQCSLGASLITGKVREFPPPRTDLDPKDDVLVYRNNVLEDVRRPVRRSIDMESEAAAITPIRRSIDNELRAASSASKGDTAGSARKGDASTNPEKGKGRGVRPKPQERKDDPEITRLRRQLTLREDDQSEHLFDFVPFHASQDAEGLEAVHGMLDSLEFGPAEDTVFYVPRVDMREAGLFVGRLSERILYMENVLGEERRQFGDLRCDNNLMSKDLSTLQGELRQEKETNTELRRGKENMSGELERLRRQLQEEKDTCSAVRANVLELTNALRRSQQEVASLNDNLDFLQQSLDRAHQNPPPPPVPDSPIFDDAKLQYGLSNKKIKEMASSSRDDRALAKKLIRAIFPLEMRVADCSIEGSSVRPSMCPEGENDTRIQWIYSTVIREFPMTPGRQTRDERIAVIRAALNQANRHDRCYYTDTPEPAPVNVLPAVQTLPQQDPSPARRLNPRGVRRAASARNPPETPPPRYEPYRRPTVSPATQAERPVPPQYSARPEITPPPPYGSRHADPAPRYAPSQPPPYAPHHADPAPPRYSAPAPAPPRYVPLSRSAAPSQPQYTPTRPDGNTPGYGYHRNDDYSPGTRQNYWHRD